MHARQRSSQKKEYCGKIYIHRPHTRKAISKNMAKGEGKYAGEGVGLKTCRKRLDRSEVYDWGKPVNALEKNTTQGSGGRQAQQCL